MAALSLAVSCDPKNNEPVVTDTLTVSPTSISFKADETRTQQVLVSTKGDWEASTTQDWIEFPTRTSGTGNGYFDVKVKPNTGGDRTGSITVKGASTVTVSVSQNGKNIKTLVPIADAFDGEKRASTTYQLLIYSFADSDGDGIGDFKGIQSKLDYLDGLGATALWLSPAHPSDSYHAYDVTDYYSLNPLYGSEDDFKELIREAHKKGIKIYMDYVLNHSGKGHSWFRHAIADPSSKYWDYYFISSAPAKEYKLFPMLSGTTYQAGEWKQAFTGSPKLKITKTDEEVTNGNANWNLYMWDGKGDKTVKFVDKGDGTFYLVADINGEWGVLLRRYMNWEAGSKFGALDSDTLKEGESMNLVWNGGDLHFTGSGRYKIEISNLSVKTVSYMGCFSDWMPDLNYGDPNNVESNECFQELAASADKWINMGIDGLRLDAVKHICGGISSYNNKYNRILLGKWYEHCNATYKAAGHSDDIFMVGEVWDENHSSEEMYYYEGINSCFEFAYFKELATAVSGNASKYVTNVNKFIDDHKKVRHDAITSLFMTNHDQNRAAESLGKNLAKEKQAAAMLLTTPGKPFIYQGEELGYYGKKESGDEYVRTPILWDKAGKDCAKKGVNNTVDTGMLTSSISVEAQSADAASLLNVYKTWSRVRNTYPALAEGTMTAADLGAGKAIGSWYMTSGSEKMLVIHNTSSKENTITATFDVSKPVVILGTVTLDHDNLTLAGNSSVVFKL